MGENEQPSISASQWPAQPCYDPESIPAHPSNMIIHIQCGHCEGLGRMSSSSSAGSRRKQQKEQEREEQQLRQPTSYVRPRCGECTACLQLNQKQMRARQGAPCAGAAASHELWAAQMRGLGMPVLNNHQACERKKDPAGAARAAGADTRALLQLQRSALSALRWSSNECARTKRLIVHLQHCGFQHHLPLLCVWSMLFRV